MLSISLPLTSPLSPLLSLLPSFVSPPSSPVPPLFLHSPSSSILPLPPSLFLSHSLSLPFSSSSPSFLQSIRYLQEIYTEGCIASLETFIQRYLYYIAGVGIGLLVFQLINIMLTAGLAIDVRKEQKALKILKERDNRQKRLSKDMAKL